MPWFAFPGAPWVFWCFGAVIPARVLPGEGQPAVPQPSPQPGNRECWTEAAKHKWASTEGMGTRGTSQAIPGAGNYYPSVLPRAYFHNTAQGKIFFFGFFPCPSPESEHQAQALGLSSTPSTRSWLFLQNCISRSLANRMEGAGRKACPSSERNQEGTESPSGGNQHLACPCACYTISDFPSHVLHRGIILLPFILLTN